MTTLTWDDIVALLPPDRDALATKHGIYFGTRHNAKLVDIDELLELYLGKVAAGVSLETAAAAGEAKGRPAISGVALHKRARKLGPFLAEIVSLMLETNATYAAPRWGGYEIVLVDGTTCVRPGGDRATARILYSLRLADLHMLDLQVSNDKQGESFRRLTCMRENQLWIGDRAYANPPGVAWATTSGADVLVRFNWASLPLFDARGRRFDVFQKLDALGTKAREWKVSVKHQDRTISGRLVVEKLPQQQAKEARAKVRRENPNASKKATKAAGYRMIFTTAPPHRLSTKEILTLYTLRWQVELKIKRDKSIEDLDQLPNFLEETIASWLYAKLLLAQLTRRVLDNARDLSPSGAGLRVAA